MAWDLPSLPVAGTIATVAGWGAKVRNCLRYLKGLDGAVTLSDALILPDGAGYYLHIPILTTTQRDNLTPTAGMLVYNSTTTQFNKYENGAWRADLGFNSDHGGLSGIGDDDHTQYALRTIMTADGDMIHRVSGAWTALAKGAANRFLRMNGAGTAPAWSTGSLVSKLLSHTRDMTAASGDVAYTGYGFTPSTLIILASGAYDNASIGLGDVNLAEMCLYKDASTSNVFTTDTAKIIWLGSTIGVSQTAVLKTLDADGFTLTWTKSGTPTGTATLIVLALG